jgi:general secretion pathway protein D
VPAATEAPPAATPAPAPPTPAPETAQAQPAPVTSPPALLRQGSLDEAARGFTAALSADPGRQLGIQALVACSPETVHKAVQNVPGEELFILPVNYKGRDCYRICWGVYPDRAAAEAATRRFPAYFRENNISPRIQPLVELLP